MNLEETKKIIENKIEAEALTKNVRRQIKSYIDQKQDVREGFKETFQPLIESKDAVKTSIDNQQNAMVKQLQENQLSLTEGLDKNRLAITQGFDKMEEVRRYDFDQLPGIEAIEHPEKETEKESVKKPIITTITYEKKQMDKYLNSKEIIDLLDSYGLKLPSEYKDKSLEEFQKAFDKGMDVTANLKKSIKNVAFYQKDSLTGLIMAFPIAGEDAKDKSKKLIKDYNNMQIFINNMGQLRDYKKITGTGIIHFNNPLQLLDRLELLAGSVFAGNNEVKQEFTQIVHLLHLLKVITKKQLNDLLKKYILNK